MIFTFTDAYGSFFAFNTDYLQEIFCDENHIAIYKTPSRCSYYCVPKTEIEQVKAQLQKKS